MTEYHAGGSVDAGRTDVDRTDVDHTGVGRSVGTDHIGPGGGPGATVPDFDVALWGYDRRQVQRCLADLSARLQQANTELESVRHLRVRLYEAQLEVDTLRREAEQRAAWSERLAEVMATAEQLRARAEEDAAALRSDGSWPDNEFSDGSRRHASAR